MQSITLAQLQDRYQQLQTQVQAQQISQEQFVEAVHQLQALDDENQWWSIDPNGNFLKYTGTEWVVSLPPQSIEKTSFKAQTQPAQFADDVPGPLRGRSCCLTSPIMVGVMSFGVAGFWFLYTSIRSMYWNNFSLREGFDILTPLMMGGIPFGIRTFQKPLDKFLQPLYSYTSRIPFPVRTGAALAIPLVLGLVSSSITGSGNGALRFTMLISMFGGYVLTRRMR